MPHVPSEDMDMTTETVTQNTASSEAIQTPKKIWITAFIFAFLTLLCDGADLGFLALSLTSLKTEFHLTGVQAGTLGSLTLFGSAVGGLIGGWAFWASSHYCILYCLFFSFNQCTGFY